MRTKTIILLFILFLAGCNKAEYKPVQTSASATVKIEESSAPVESEQSISDDSQISYNYDEKTDLYIPEPWPADINGEYFDRLEHYELLEFSKEEYEKINEKTKKYLEGRGADYDGDKLIPFLEKHGFSIDNDTELGLLLTREYALDELRNYFGEYTRNEAAVLRIRDESGFLSDHWLESQNHLYIEKVNERYPIEVLRYMGYGKLYTVYRVKEGGYFIVFWSYSKWNNIFLLTDPELVIANGVVYFEKLPTLEDYCGFIEIGATTWKDLIDFQDIPYMDHNAGGNITWQPLKNGDILSITFQLDLKNDHAAGAPYSKTDYTVNSITYYPVGTKTTWMDSLLIADREFII